MLVKPRLGQGPRRLAQSALWDINLAGALSTCRLTDGKRTHKPGLSACCGHRCALKIASVFM